MKGFQSNGPELMHKCSFATMVNCKSCQCDICYGNSVTGCTEKLAFQQYKDHEAKCATIYVAICTYPFGQVAMWCRFGMFVAVKHCIPQPQIPWNKYKPCTPAILSQWIFSVIFMIFRAFIRPINKIKVFSHPWSAHTGRIWKAWIFSVFVSKFPAFIGPFGQIK